MKLKATVEGSVSRPAFGRLLHHIRDTVLSGVTTHHIERELQDELRSVSASERLADPETRRDALERAVRRIWGATL